MLCSTTKNGLECAMMSSSGCVNKGGTCLPVVEPCEGCDRTMAVGDKKYCKSYPDPSAKWRLGDCNFATHVKSATKEGAKINPIKASKRTSKKKK